MSLSEEDIPSDDGLSVGEYILNAMEREWPRSDWQDDVVLIAVSGGADSMALIELVTRVAPCSDRVKVIHCNHGLRGDESDADEEFVLDQCLHRNVECISIRFQQEETQDTSEDGLRRIRYKYFEDVATELGCKWVVLGHHVDDDIETFFLRLFRGTGTRGLSGIPARRIVTRGEESIEYVRPLLSVSKAQLQKWLISEGVVYREDSSNSQSNYTRNRIRNELFPIIDDIAPKDWKRRISTLMSELAELNSTRHTLATQLLERLGPELDQIVVRFPIGFLEGYSWEIVREFLVELWMLKRWPLRGITRKHWKSVERMLSTARETQHPIALQLPQGMRLRIRQKVVSIWRDE